MELEIRAFTFIRYFTRIRGPDLLSDLISPLGSDSMMLAMSRKDAPLSLIPANDFMLLLYQPEW